MIKVISSKGRKHILNKIIKSTLILLGSISVALGVLGIFLPILPTTPFLLLGAACYLKTSSKLYNWLINHKLLGKYVKSYYEGKGIPRATKVWAIILLWISISYSTFFIIYKPFVRVVLLIVASCVTYHILSQDTLKKEA